MKYYLIIVFLAGINFTACSSSKNISKPNKIKKEIYQKPNNHKLKIYHKTMQKIALSTKTDSSYEKITLDTAEKKSWFKNLMFRLWDRRITRKQFIKEGLRKYPTHSYEFNFVANGFQSNS